MIYEEIKNLSGAEAANWIETQAVRPEFADCTIGWAGALRARTEKGAVFSASFEDTDQTHVREDGVCWSTGGTRSWEVRDQRGNLVVAVYCHDRGGLGF